MAKRRKGRFFDSGSQIRSVGRWILNQGFCDLFSDFLPKNKQLPCVRNLKYIL